MTDALDHDDLSEAMITASLGPRTSGIRAQMNQNQYARGNTPLAGVSSKLAVNSPSYNVPAGVLWIVDRLIEPQTIAHFLQFAAGTGDLPGGKKSAIRDTQASLEADFLLIQDSPSKWAPATAAPFNTETTPFIYRIMTRVGSLEDNGRMQCMSKDLHFLKSRLWEGIMPLSDAAWRERGLDQPANFPQACQVITSVIEVFQYLDQPQVRDALRTTYNLIYDHLFDFERALNAKRAADAAAATASTAASSDDKDDKDNKDEAQAAAPIQIAALWAEYMTAHFAQMETRTHAWVTGRIESLSKTVLGLLRAHRPLARIRPGPSGFDEAQWCLTNMWQDLMQNQTCADIEMFVPVQGFKGMRPGYTASGRPTTEEGAVTEGAAQDATGDTPLPGQLHWAHSDIGKRVRMYQGRRRELQMRLIMSETMADLYLGRPRPAGNDPEILAAGCEQQALVQRQMRQELRGVPYSYPTTSTAGEKESWVTEARRDEYNIVVYRGCHGHDDDEWNRFVEAFEMDIDSWGKTGDVRGADDFRGKTRLSWRNVADEYELGGDVEAIKAHFREELKDETPAPAITDFFLLVDKASIDSYLDPPKPGPIPKTSSSSSSTRTATAPLKTLLAGDIGGFILAIEATFDPWTPADDARRAAECPGYKGAMRVRSCMVWDDLVAGYVMQNQLIEDLWPMARVHPREMYVGPVVRAQLQAWGELGLGLGESDGREGGGEGQAVNEEELARMVNDAATCVPG